MLNSYNGWTELVLKDTKESKKKAPIFKKVIAMLQKKARDRHAKNLAKGRDWRNHYLDALESLVKSAWIFETVPNLLGALKNTFKGIGPSCEALIHEETKNYDGESLWLQLGANENNRELLMFIQERTKLETCKSILTFLHDNSEVSVNYIDDVSEIFKRDLDVQMLIAGFWFQKHNEIVKWKKW